MKLKLHRAEIGRRLRPVAAFTMIEIALALGVIGFALVAIIGVLPAGMSVQRDNRESTLINFDANFLMDAITSGTTGLDDLTNHVIAITNYYTFFNVNTAGVITSAEPTHYVGYTPTGTFTDKGGGAGLLLTSGSNIISLLTTPKYVPVSFNGILNGFYSNYTTADFRAITSSLADQGTSQAAQSFAFAYRIYPEIVPYAAVGEPWTNNPDPNQVVANNFQANFTQIRIRFRWPILPNGQMGTSRLTFRTSAGGALVLGTPFVVGSATNFPAFIEPGTYVGQ